MGEALVLAAGSVLVLFNAFLLCCGRVRELFPGPPPPHRDVRRMPAALLIAVKRLSDPGGVCSWAATRYWPKAEAQPAPGTREDSEYDGSGLPEDLLKQWEKHGGLEHNLKQAQTTASAVLDALEPADAAAIQQSFDALPESAQTTIYGFMAVRAPAGRQRAIPPWRTSPARPRGPRWLPSGAMRRRASSAT